MRVMLTRALAVTGISLLIAITFSRVSIAMTIDSYKEGKVLLNLDGGSAKPGETYLVTDSDGKRRAFVKITQVKGSKALGTVLKGKLTKPANSYTLQSHELGRGGSGGSGHAPPSAWGATFGYAQNQMKVTISDTASVNMTGTGMNLEAFYERQLDGAVQVLGRGGYQTLKTAGTTTGLACQGSNNCTVELSYLGFDGLVKYSFFTSKITYWLGAGLGFSYAMSKSSNVLDVSKISINQKILGDLGLNWYMSRKSFIPVQFEYVYFPNNNVVSSSQMILRIGYGQTF